MADIIKMLDEQSLEQVSGGKKVNPCPRTMTQEQQQTQLNGRKSDEDVPDFPLANVTK